MARPVSVEMAALLNGAQRVLHKRARTRNASGTWIDVSAWVLGWRFGEGLDDASEGGTITFRRHAVVGGVAQSLAPLLEASPLNVDDDGLYAPLINPLRALELFEAPTAPGVARPADGDAAWRPVFRGLLDDPDVAGGDAEITAGIRGESARLADQQIEQETAYPSLPLAALLQAILDGAQANETLVTVGDPEWVLDAFTQPVGSVLEALRKKAEDIGWTVRRVWQADDTFPLVLYEPTRDTAVADLVIAPAMVPKRPTRFPINGTNVRNAFRGWYTDAETGQRAFRDYEVSASIATVGRRWMQLVSERIGTAAEMDRMLAAVASDLSTPIAEMTVELLPDLRLQLGDVLEFPAMPGYFDSVQWWGVVQIEQTRDASARGGATVVTVRGTPAGAYRRWLQRAGEAFDRARGGPNPIVGPFCGETSRDGGLYDEPTFAVGACWLALTFDANTDAIEVYTAVGPASPLAAPPLDTLHLATTVRRQEGVVPSADDWDTVHLMETVATMYRKVYVRPVGKDGTIGLPRLLQTQATDQFTATLGGFTAFSVARDGVTSVLTWTAEASSSPYPVEIFVWRNGSVIDRIPRVTSGTYTDSDVLPDREYTYELQQVTTNGVNSLLSGPRSSYRRPPQVEEPPPPDAGPVDPGDEPSPGDPAGLVPPEWLGNYPIAYMSGGVRQSLEIGGVCDDPYAASVLLEGLNAGRWVAIQAYPIVPEEVFVRTPLSVPSAVTTFRLVSRTANGTIRDYSGSRVQSEVEGDGAGGFGGVG